MTADSRPYRYLEEREMPGLFLGIRVNPIETHYDEKQGHRMLLNRWNLWAAKPGFEFEYLAHQTGGYACHQHYFWATKLKPTERVARLMSDLNDHWQDSCAGQWGVTLNTILEYRHMLQPSFDCNRTYQSFEEGIYPLDLLGREGLQAACVDEFAQTIEDLNEIIQWPEDSGELIKICGLMDRWNLVILGENCD